MARFVPAAEQSDVLGKLRPGDRVGSTGIGVTATCAFTRQRTCCARCCHIRWTAAPSRRLRTARLETSEESISSQP